MLWFTAKFPFKLYTHATSYTEKYRNSVGRIDVSELPFYGRKGGEVYLYMYNAKLKNVQTGTHAIKGNAPPTSGNI